MFINTYAVIILFSEPKKRKFEECLYSSFPCSNSSNEKSKKKKNEMLKYRNVALSTEIKFYS